MANRPQRYDAADLRRFFTAVDANLSREVSITVLGGSAIALYGVSSGTTDIDTLETRVVQEIQPAIERAKRATGLDIPVVPAGVADVPYDSADRVEREAGDWEHLSVFKLEPHDLALSKALRASEADLAAIEALHRVVPLDCETLVTRHLDEMGHAIGDPVQRDLRFLLMIERLYGQVEAHRVERRIRERRKPPARGR